MTILFSFHNVAHSFDWQKCRAGAGAPGIGGMTSSTTQWTSSWGACSMLGVTPRERPKVFLTLNPEKIIEDSSKAGGEYLSAFSRLSYCDSYTELELPKRLQSNFEKTFTDTPKETFQNITDLVKNDPTLSCKYLGG